VSRLLTPSSGPPPRLLVALADEGEACALAEPLERAGWQVRVAAPEDAKRVSEKDDWTAILAEADSGRELLGGAEGPGPAVILIAGFGTISDAVAAVRGGAFDYLSRPVSADRLLAPLARALERRALHVENRRLRETLDERRGLGLVQTRDPRMRRVLAVVEAVADTRASVLITGESGTGKSLLARTVHERSSRRDRPFVLIDCGALPPTLLESELFGHARGAFTGALRDKAGLVEAADGGTVLLDEIASASLDLQVKLLRVVQERAFERVGETETRSVDIRLLAATNRDLEREVAAGRFREDLYYRINVVRLDLPPLRERTGDVPLLAATFLERYRAEYGRDVRGFSPAALRLLVGAPWPGNVRQLEHCVERAVLLAHGEEIEPGDLAPEVRELGSADAAGPLPAGARRAAPLDAEAWDPASSPTLREALEGPERRIIERALALNGGNRKRTAAMLGVNRTTLFNKMRKYGLLDPRAPS